MRKAYLLFLFVPLILGACSPVVDPQTEGNPGTNQNIDENPTETEKEVIEDEYTATITFHGNRFASDFPEGTNFNNEEKFAQFLNYLDEQLEYYDLINGVNCTYCTSRTVNSDTFFQIGTGSAKNGFNEGRFDWTCKEKIYKVEISAFNYSKPYTDYQTGNIVPNVDNLAHLKLDDVDKSFEISETASPITQTVSKEYPNGVNAFKVRSYGGRMLIKEMKITWRG